MATIQIEYKLPNKLSQKYRFDAKSSNIGGFSWTFPGYRRTDNQKVLIKAIQNIPNHSIEFRDKYAKREYKILKDVGHNCILTLIDYFPAKDGEQPVLVFEFYENGNLDEFFRKFKNNASYPSESLSMIKMKVIFGLLSSIHYLHSRKIIHRDIKPANIVLDKNECPILIDFGLARYLYKKDTELDQNLTACGTQYYQAPEVKTHSYTFSADIYSFGYVCIFMFTKAQNFLPTVEETRKSLSGIPEEMIDMIIKCINEIPNKRPTSIELIQFFTQFNSDSLPFDLINNEKKIMELKEYIDFALLPELKEVLKCSQSSISTADLLILENQKLIQSILKLEKENKQLRNKMNIAKDELKHLVNSISVSSLIKAIEICQNQPILLKYEGPDSIGVFGFLSLHQQSKFHSNFIASQSSNDIYNLLFNNNDNYCFPQPDTYVDIHFKNSINVQTFGIVTSEFNDFLLKSFILYGINESRYTQLLNQNNDPNLLKPNNSVIYHLNNNEKFSLLRFVVKEGISRNNGINATIKSSPVILRHINFNNYQFPYYPQSNYCRIDNVLITGNSFGFSSFFQKNPINKICTFGSKENDVQWFEVSLVDYSLISNGYSIWRTDNITMNTWSIYGADENDEWEMIHENTVETSASSVNSPPTFETFRISDTRPYTKFRLYSPTKVLLYYLDFYVVLIPHS
ncbi:hypothetical protein TRFO_26414 [Tritrichomonas foetus]|uniref:Protein kinase domain-containing protein n=1 Tax=Tritrichomonas foetus TaxID=1144522 RepID=A0A1J4K8P4_9EUKA|nr:hypothetical protein TRFO_26414 [Tritrichomonas foetus]|eukprot:OHT05805.1 hypothetical protein TRFO_26414 [Tritrichomonas foetus]